MADSSTQAQSASIPAGQLPPWTVGDLPPAPPRGWKRWATVVGPGVLLAGASIGSGEWLFGPAVSATYGGTLLWLATLSVLGQVFCNLEMIRYTLYCGEPIIVGYFRTKPGPLFWTCWFVFLDFSSIWPFNVANAAVVAAAAMIGHLPQEGVEITGLGLTTTETGLVKILGLVLFLLAFLPLIFGGTIYRMLLRIFTFKLVVVLVYLIVFAILTVSATNAWEVISGSFRFGRVGLRAQTIIADRHFHFTEKKGDVEYTIKGTVHNDRVDVSGFMVTRDGKTEKPSKEEIARNYQGDYDRLIAVVKGLARKNRFVVEDDRTDGKVRIEGAIDPEQGTWKVERIVVPGVGGDREFTRLQEVPEPFAARARTLTEHQGLEEVNVFSYVAKHGKLPAVDWATLAAFVGIAGAGGLTNIMYSSFARDKGWGMGARVGAIPSLIGGMTISLSHVGQAFRVNETNRPRWRGWMRYIVEDQVVVWMLCNFLGFALPCMLSLQFIRHAPVADAQVAAQIAEGMEHHFPQTGLLLWYVTLAVGFLVLYPGQIMAGDVLARRWTDIIWTANPLARRMEPHQVKYVYYTILLAYGLWGVIPLLLFSPLVIAKIGPVLMNLALGATALHALYVNKTLLPRELRPNWFMQLGVLLCGAFFLGITVIVVLTL